MKNILILTSAIEQNDFNIFQEKALIKPNPSNQNFYNKLINCLALNNNVKVVSLRPFIKGMFKEKYLERCTKTIDKVDYVYACSKLGLKNKIFFEKKEIIECSNSLIEKFNGEDFIIILDCLRYNLVNSAIKISQKYKVQSIGVLTDNPYNLSYSSRRFSKKLINRASKLSAYLSLTNKLLEDFKIISKPSYVFEGLVEDIKADKNSDKNYFFFGGSLYERYGVKNLINAFSNNEVTNKLIVAGNGPLKKEIQESDSIKFLGQISKEQIYSYEQNCLANINPRPLIDRIDLSSIPSKLLDYLASGKPTISTKHPLLFETFKGEVFWIDNSSEKGIEEAINKFNNTPIEIKEKMSKEAKRKVIAKYGIINQNKNINYFIDSLIHSSK